MNKLHERFAPEIVELQPNNSNISEAKTNYKIHNLFFLIIFKKKKVGVEMAVSIECCMGRRDGEFTTHQPSPPPTALVVICVSVKNRKKYEFKKKSTA